MKKRTIQWITALALGGVAWSPVFAAQGHGGMQGMEGGQGMAMDAGGAGQGAMKGMAGGHAMAMDSGQTMGPMIRETKVDGYTLAYHVLDMKQRMEAMKDMPGMSAMKGMDASQMASHHLMVYIVGPDGKNVDDAKVGYLVKGPDGTEQKAMTMGMTGGHGADVDFKAKGTYDIKTKAIVGDQRLVDEFQYEVK